MNGDPPPPPRAADGSPLPSPDPSTERRFGPLQLLTRAALFVVLLLPLAHYAGYWPQNLCLCLTAPDGARVTTLAGQPVDAAVPAQLQHRIAWCVDGAPWCCPIRLDHLDGVANGRLRGHNRGGFQSSHLAPIDHVESCDGSLWLHRHPRRVEVLPPRAGHCWLVCDLSEERRVTHAGSTAKATRQWHSALPAHGGEHQLDTDRWTLAVHAPAGTCIQLVEVPTDTPFVQIVDDDSGFANAELQRGTGPAVKSAPDVRHPCGVEPLAIAFAGSDGIAPTRVLLRLAAGAGLGLIVRASRAH